MTCEFNKIDPITKWPDAIKYLDLGMMPLVNNVCNSREESLICEKYPLAVQYFKRTGLSMLTHTVPPEKLYEHYVYKSGVSQPYIEHCKDIYDFVNYYLHS